MYLPEKLPVRTLLVAHNAGKWQQQEHQPRQLCPTHNPNVLGAALPLTPTPIHTALLDLGGAVLSALAAMCCAPFLADYNGTWHLGTKQREAYVYSMMNIPLNLHTRRCGPVGSCTQLWPVWLGLRTGPACQLPLALADPLHVV